MITITEDATYDQIRFTHTVTCRRLRAQADHPMSKTEATGAAVRHIRANSRGRQRRFRPVVASFAGTYNAVDVYCQQY